jgi:hypothetical protein
MIAREELDPVHTRDIVITAAAAAGGARRIQGRVIDLRHRATTWVGRLATRPGVVHDMSAEMVVDGEDRVAHAAGAMARAAFTPSAETGFEGCRDILGNVAALAGARVGQDLQRDIGAAIGGRRGCYHLTTLVRAMASVAAHPRIEERRLRVAAWRRGGEAAVIEADLADAGAGRGSPGRAELARARLAFEVAVGDPRPHALRAAHRVTADDGSERCCDRSAATTAAIAALPLLPGFGRMLAAHTAGEGTCAALVELAFAVSGVASQILLHLEWPEVVTLAGAGGRAANTCVMWRDGGPLAGLPIAKDDA